MPVSEDSERKAELSGAKVFMVFSRAYRSSMRTFRRELHRPVFDGLSAASVAVESSDCEGASTDAIR